MNMEHKAIIERARLHNVPPSALAHELLVHDLVEAAMFELRNISAPYSRLNEGSQQEVIDRITEKATDAVSYAVQIIASRGAITIPCKMKQIQVTEKTLTVTSLVDAKDPARHGLTDSAGHLCLLVLAPDDYNEGLDFIQPDRDQADLPLHVSDLTGSLFDGKATDLVGGNDPLFEDAKAQLTAYGRLGPAAIAGSFAISSERAARMLEAMSNQGFANSFDGGKVYELAKTGPDEPQYTDLAPESDPLYAEAVAFVVETRRASISAVQRKLKVGFNRAAVLIDAMEKAGVISPLDHSGGREVLISEAASNLPNELIDSIAHDDKEFGDFTYTDAKQLVILHATDISIGWLQHRLAIDSDKASTLALRLLDDGVTALETEGDSPIDNIYVVKVALADLKAG